MSTTHLAVMLPDDEHVYFGELLASIDGILWEADIHTNQFTYVSEQAERLLGYPAAQWLIPDFWVEHMHPDDRDRTVRFYALATHEQRNDSFEYRMITNDGRIIWLRDIVTIVMEEARATKLRGIMVDVTERKRTEEALSKVERQLFTLLEHFPDFIVRFDHEGRFCYANPAVENASGITLDQFVGKTIHELAAKPDVQNDHLHAAIRQAFDEKRPNTVEALFSTQSGERYFEIRHIPEEDEHGRVVSVLGITREITEQKRAEEERKVYLWFLESMDKVNRVLQGTIDIERMLRELLDVVRVIFACDRAWLLYPSELNATTWPISMESTRPEYVDALALPSRMPIDPTHVQFLQTVIAARKPIKFGPEAPNPLPDKISAQFRIQATLAMAICPKNDQPYLLALHQCSDPRQWTPQEERLFQEIGRRLGDALTSSLAYQRLQESELRYRTFVDHAADAFFLHDQRGAIVDVNRQACASLGYSHAEFMQMMPSAVSGKFCLFTARRGF